MEPLDASPHGDGLGGRWCGWRGPPQRVDEAPELQSYVHFCGGAEDDGGAAEDGHLAKGVRRKGDSGNTSTAAQTAPQDKLLEKGDFSISTIKQNSEKEQKKRKKRGLKASTR